MKLAGVRLKTNKRKYLLSMHHTMEIVTAGCRGCQKLAQLQEAIRHDKAREVKQRLLSTKASWLLQDIPERDCGQDSMSSYPAREGGVSCL